MERAIKDLCRLSGDALFREIAVGIGHVMDTANGLDAAAHQLAAAEHHHPARVLRNLAEEEAAKALILIRRREMPTWQPTGEKSDPRLLSLSSRQRHLR